MIHKITVWAVCAALVVTITGCNCCQASEAGKSTAHEAPTAQHPKKAVTPDGEVLWVVAEWDACCTPCNGKQTTKTCKSAKCWKTKDGKVLCVKPLKSCPTHGKTCSAAEHYQCGKEKNKAVMCTQDDPAKMTRNPDGKCCFAAKEITPCPANGGAACQAKEHVNLPEGKKGCAKADREHPAPGNAMIPMDSSFESDEVFEITAAD